jgi:osmoprotectant transport system ATP-binding protein
MSPADPPSTTESPVIEFRNVTYQPANKPKILDSVSFSVAKGETLVLLGRSGAGKTTALKLVNRLLDATGGEILVKGRPVSAWDPIKLRRSMGYVIQESGLFPHYSVEKNIGLVPRLEGWSAARIAQRTSELMRLVGLEPAEFAHRYPHQLSGGQRQRVGVARALAADPEILLMDEPFGALDPITRADLQQEFAQLQQNLRKTVLLVTHDLREGLLLGDRLVLFEGGKVAGISTKADFLRSKDPAVVNYIEPFRREIALGI